MSDFKIDELVTAMEKAGEDQSIKEFECPYVPDFFVSIRYSSKFALSQIREATIEKRLNVRTRQEEEHMNEAKLRNEYVHMIIKGWRGLTLTGLRKLLPSLKIPEGTDMNKEIPFDYSVAAALLGKKGSLEFEAWVVDVAQNVENFSPVAEIKKEQYDNLKK